MKNWMSLTVLLLITLPAWSNPSVKDIFEETLYSEFKNEILTTPSKSLKKVYGFTPIEQSLFVDALWDLTEEGDPRALSALEDIHSFHYQLIDKLRIEILRLKYARSTSLSEELITELKSTLLNPMAETRLIYTLAAYEDELLKAGHQDVIELARNHSQYFDIAEDAEIKKEITNDIVADLFHNSPDVTTYMNGEYVKSIKLFMFCRQNRLYPCLMVMKDIHGEAVRNADGTLWTHKALASSARGLPSYTRNGNTPEGIHTIDSVMPVADQQLSFGKFRRLILNFVPKSKEESLSKALLPASSHGETWWRNAVTARDIGRNLFRIHGTGRINKDPSTPYYPFMRTSGCIAQRENSYDGVTFRDQQDLKDTIMTAMDFTPSYANEIKIKGILFLMELDDESGEVVPQDLAIKGIE